MREPTNKDYLNNTIRFCQILTQYKYEEIFDKQIKKFIKDNLECYLEGSVRNEKRKLQHVILDKCKTLINCQYNTEEDLEIKAEIAKILAKISKLDIEQLKKREERARKNQTTKLALCIGGKND